MHRFPKLFNSNNKNKMNPSSKSQPTTPTRPDPKPKLTRRNAAKNIHYDPDPSPSPSTSASTSSYSSNDSLTIRTRSIDVYPWGDRTSFRINGKEEGELDFIYKSLGLNGPDDFGIEPDDYRVMKARYPQLSSQLERDSDGSVSVGIDRSRSDGVNASKLSRSGNFDGYRVMKARYGQLSSGGSSFVNVAGVEVEKDNEGLVDARGSSAILGSRSGSVDDYRVMKARYRQLSSRGSSFVNVGGVEVERGHEVLVDARGSSANLGSRSGVNGNVDDYRVIEARYGQLSSRGSSFVNVGGVEVEGGDGVLVNARGRSVNLGIRRSRGGGVELSRSAHVNSSVGVKLCAGVLENGELLGQVSRFVDVSGGEVEGDVRDNSVNLGIDRSRSDGVTASVDYYQYGELSSQFSNFVDTGGVEVEGDDGVLVDARGSSVVLGIDRSRSDGGNASVDDALGKVSTFVNVNGVGDARVSRVSLGIDRSKSDGVNLYDGVLGNGRLCSGVVDDVVSGLIGEGGKMLLSRERIGVGIKGERPPAVLLTPPPRMALPVIDDVGSSWDILRSFGPENDSIYRIEYDQRESSSEDEGPCSAQEDVIEGDDDGVTRETIVDQGRGLISDSCSFSSNSNDDSSSTTTEPTSISPNGRLIRPISTWVKGKHLGSGSYGSVYEGYADGGFFFAVKEVSLLDQGERGREIIYQFEQEMAFLSQFNHINIVRYLGTDKDDSNLYIFLELLPQGSLMSLYQRFCFQDSHVSGYTRQILEGLKYLHECNVVHRDIKCANILLGVDGIVKLADFGLAKVDKLNDAKSTKGTSYWMAPEVVRPNQKYGRAADIWSLGCTVLEMLTQKFPYHPMEGIPAMFRIGSGQPPPVPDSLSRDARDFILNCLQVNPATRPTAAELLEHPFVKLTN